MCVYIDMYIYTHIYIYICICILEFARALRAQRRKVELK